MIPLQNGCMISTLYKAWFWISPDRWNRYGQLGCFLHLAGEGTVFVSKNSRDPKHCSEDSLTNTVLTKET